MIRSPPPSPSFTQADVGLDPAPQGAPIPDPKRRQQHRSPTHSVFILRMARRDMMASVTAFLNCLQGNGIRRGWGAGICHGQGSAGFGVGIRWGQRSIGVGTGDPSGSGIHWGFIGVGDPLGLEIF